MNEINEEHRHAKKIFEILWHQKRRSAKALWSAMIKIVEPGKPRNANGTRNLTEAMVRHYCEILQKKGWLQIHSRSRGQIIYILSLKGEEWTQANVV